MIAEPDYEVARADFEHVWQTYSAHVIEYVRRRLGNHPRRDADEEDIALSAMGSFYRGLAEQRFGLGEDDGDLWNLLCGVGSEVVLSASVAFTSASYGTPELKEDGPSEAVDGRRQHAAVSARRGHLCIRRHQHGDAEVSVGNRHLCGLAPRLTC